MAPLAPRPSPPILNLNPNLSPPHPMLNPDQSARDRQHADCTSDQMVNFIRAASSLPLPGAHPKPWPNLAKKCQKWPRLVTIGPQSSTFSFSGHLWSYLPESIQCALAAVTRPKGDDQTRQPDRRKPARSHDSALYHSAFHFFACRIGTILFASTMLPPSPIRFHPCAAADFTLRKSVFGKEKVKFWMLYQPLTSCW
jgi:hypothetical protein